MSKMETTRANDQTDSHISVALDTQNNEELGASIGLENDDDLFLWNVTFEGPEDSLYEVSFKVKLPLSSIPIERCL